MSASSDFFFWSSTYSWLGPLTLLHRPWNKVLQVCQCDPILKLTILSAESCNIDSQTILRPASGRISGQIIAENYHTYEVSSQCPFNYCLPHFPHLNLSNPDSQCQFNRTCVLCGRCKVGLSTMFGTF